MADFALLKQPDWLCVSRETVEALEEFANLVLQWTARINLISPSTTPDIWGRHILDSAQLFQLAAPGASWVDLGTGGGFPGVVLAILAKEIDPNRRFQFVESDQRKSAFLRKACQHLGLPAICHASRAEAIGPLAAETITARALAPLVDLLSLVERHLAPGGRAILPKGAKAMDEIELARKRWSFDLTRRVG
jgi:16S rRNA (guanine527-N7)-methyltransferase